MLANSWRRQRKQPPGKADSTLRYSQAVPHPSTNRALRRLTSEVGRDPVHSTRYARQRWSSPAASTMGWACALAVLLVHTAAGVRLWYGWLSQKLGGRSCSLAVFALGVRRRSASGAEALNISDDYALVCVRFSVQCWQPLASRLPPEKYCYG